MKGTSPAVRTKFLEIEQKRILLEMEAEQEVIEAARKKARKGEIHSIGGPNSGTVIDETSVGVSEVQNETVTATVIDENEEELVTGAMLCLS